LRRRIFFFALGGLLASALACAVLLIAVAYGWQRDWLRREFEVRLTAALQVPISIGAIEGPLHRDVSMRAILVGEPSAPLLEIDAVRVQLEALQLTGTPTLVISELDLIRPRLQLRRGLDGRWPWEAREQVDPSPLENWPLAVVAGSVALEAGAVEITGGSEFPLRLEFDGVLDDARVGADVAIGKFSFTFAALRPAADTGSAIAGSLEASYTKERFGSIAFRAEGPGFDAQVLGSGTLDRIDHAQLSARIASIDAFDDLFLDDALAISGSVSISADLRGALRWPTGTVVVDAEDIHTADLQLGALRLEMASEREGVLRVDGLRLDGGPFELIAEPGALIVADGTQAALRGLELHQKGGTSTLKIDLETSPALPRGFDALLRDPTTRVSVEAQGWPLGTLAPFWRLMDIEVSGLLDANLALVGADPEPQLRGSAQLQSGNLRFSDAEVVGLALDLEVGGTPLAPRGRLGASAQAIRWAGAPLGALRVAFETPDGRAAEVEEFALSGGPLSLRVEPGARLRVDRDGIAFEELDLMLEDQQLLASGWISPNAAEALRVEFPQLDAARLSEIAAALGAPANAVEIAGEVAGHLQWDGPIVEPTLAGRLRWSDARLGDLVFERIEAGLDTSEGMVEIDSHWTYEGRVALDVDVVLPSSRILTDPASLLDDPRMSLRARADAFELASLARFLPPAVSSLAGSLTANLRATGGRFPANVSGELTIERGAATLRALGGQLLSPISARASLADNHVELDGFQIGEEDAQIRGVGKLGISSGRPGAIDLHLRFENYAIDAPGLVKGTLDGPIDLTGTADAPVLRGSLELSDLKVQIPEPDSVELKEILVISADGNDAGAVPREGEAAAPLLDSLRLDLDVAVRRNSWARGRGAEIELQGNLEAKKDPQQPLLLSGIFETVRGTYQIYGRRFRIDRGEVVLDGAADVDPVLDIRAEHRVRDVKLFALLAGRLSEPTLRFESEPELSETDIASYLFLGRPADAVSSEEQPALDAAAVQIAAGAALSEFERLFGGTLPVDMLDVRIEGEGEESEVRAGFGKYVGERLFLYYEHGFGDEPEEELRAEYELTPHWSVESTLSTDDDVGADLILEFEN
jgi:autotransporter translocation and assembly factor TamB